MGLRFNLPGLLHYLLCKFTRVTPYPDGARSVTNVYVHEFRPHPLKRQYKTSTVWVTEPPTLRPIV